MKPPAAFRTADGIRRHPSPESAAAELAAVVAVEIRLRLARAGAHPGIHQHQVRHPRILPDIHQRGRCAVAESPETHVAHIALRLLERVDRGADVRGGALEARELSVAVAHARKIEAQHRRAARCERARQQHELAVTADAVLRTADHDYHAARRGCPASAAGAGRRSGARPATRYRQVPRDSSVRPRQAPDGRIDERRDDGDLRRRPEGLAFHDRLPHLHASRTHRRDRPLRGDTGLVAARPRHLEPVPGLPAACTASAGSVMSSSARTRSWLTM